jgi:hypothetical protein
MSCREPRSVFELHDIDATTISSWSIGLRRMIPS